MENAEKNIKRDKKKILVLAVERRQFYRILKYSKAGVCCYNPTRRMDARVCVCVCVEFVSCFGLHPEALRQEVS
jgi:hypothetical protein